MAGYAYSRVDSPPLSLFIFVFPKRGTALHRLPLSLPTMPFPCVLLSTKACFLRGNSVPYGPVLRCASSRHRQQKKRQCGCTRADISVRPPTRRALRAAGSYVHDRGPLVAHHHPSTGRPHSIRRNSEGESRICASIDTLYTKHKKEQPKLLGEQPSCLHEAPIHTPTTIMDYLRMASSLPSFADDEDMLFLDVDAASSPIDYFPPSPPSSVQSCMMPPPYAPSPSHHMDPMASTSSMALVSKPPLGKSSPSSMTKSQKLKAAKQLLTLDDVEREILRHNAHLPPDAKRKMAKAEFKRLKHCETVRQSRVRKKVCKPRVPCAFVASTPSGR